MAKEHTFSVTMDYLREIVAKQTFRESPAAALRELIQNAHDACLIDSALTNRTDYAIHITLDPQEKMITIQDNGVGMTIEDVHEYLTTVGRGKKGAAITEKFRVPARASRRLEDVIGEFGFGFIAAFIIADRIELWTRSARDESATAIHCVFSTEDVAYTWEEVDTTLVDTGTKLVLSLNRATQSSGLRPTENPIEGNILSWDTVEAIIKKYCILLEFPIFVSMQGEVPAAPINRIEPPWEAEQRIKESVKHFYETRAGTANVGEFLHVIRVALSRSRGDSVDVNGVLLLEDTPETGTPPGNLEVFVKRMWVCEYEQDLLPAWASFLRGVIVTPELRPLPGRDALDARHDAYDRVKLALHRVVYDAFIQLAQTNQRTFNAILDRHGREFRWGIIKEKQHADDEKRPLTEAELVRYVRFIRYGRRYMSGNICNLNDYLNMGPTQPLSFRERKRVVYIVARPVQPDRQLEFRRLLASRALDVIVPNDESEFGILVAIEQLYADIVVRNVEHELLKDYAGILEGEQRTRWASFLRYYEQLSKDHHMAGADVGSLEPEYMPALIVSMPGGAASGEEEIQRTADTESERAKALKRFIVMGVPPEVADVYTQTLVINSRNPVMRELLEYKENAGLDAIDPVLDVCLHEAYHMALQAALDSMPADMLRHQVEIESKVIREYVKSHSERYSEASGDRAVRDKIALLESELADYRSRFGELDKSQLVAPREPEERLGVVVFCDMVGSTGSLIGMDFDHRGVVMNEFVNLARDNVVEHGGYFDKFTGDGLMALFGLECEAQPDGSFSADDYNNACSRAWVFCEMMHAAVQGLNNKPEIRNIIERNAPQVQAIQLRTALACGPVLFGSFGGRGTAVGIPVVIAARLCSEKDAFRAAGTSILASERFQVKSGLSGFEEVDYKFRPAGMSVEERVYKRRNATR